MINLDEALSLLEQWILDDCTYQDDNGKYILNEKQIGSLMVRFCVE